MRSEFFEGGEGRMRAIVGTLKYQVPSTDRVPGKCFNIIAELARKVIGCEAIDTADADDFLAGASTSKDLQTYAEADGAFFII